MKKRWPVLLLVLVLVLVGIGAGLWVYREKQPVILCGDEISLDNTDFAYFYWSEFFYFSEVYGDYLGDQLDLSKPLSEQALEPGYTWEDYLLDDALQTVRDTLVMVRAAGEAGFTLDGDYDAQYQQALVDFSSAAASQGKSLRRYLRDSYGPWASEERFSQYLYWTHLAAAYADQLLEQIVITDQEVQLEFQQHQEDYEAVYGLDPEQPEQWMETIREELRTQAYQNEFRGLQTRFPIEVRREAIRLSAPKGLYE